MKKVIKRGRRILGFIEKQADGGFSYAFGKPSARCHIVFYGDDKPLTEKEARNRILDT